MAWVDDSTTAIFHGLSHNKSSNITNYETANANVKLDLNTVIPLYLIFLATCLAGNLLVCVTVMRNSEMRRKRWYYLLVNLSVADIGFALITPLHLMTFTGIDTGKSTVLFQLPWHLH